MASNTTKVVVYVVLLAWLAEISVRNYLLLRPRYTKDQINDDQCQVIKSRLQVSKKSPHNCVRLFSSKENSQNPKLLSL
jgi:hypothetical protein